MVEVESEHLALVPGQHWPVALEKLDLALTRLETVKGHPLTRYQDLRASTAVDFWAGAWKAQSALQPFRDCGKKDVDGVARLRHIQAMLRPLLVAALAALLAILLGTPPALAYQVRPGDTLWSISRRSGVPVSRLVRTNHLSHPDRIYPGQDLALDLAPPPPRSASNRELVVRAAEARGLNPNFALAVAHWESGFDQSRVSRDGAIGLMQILPSTAAWAGPALLGRRADIQKADDNALLGCALLRRYLDEFNDPKLALAAYYQGEAAARRYGIYPSSRSYVDGIWALRNRYQDRS